MRTTHTSSVTEDMIDHLGHMNVRYYAVNAHAGTRAVLADLPGWGDRLHLVHDTYTRHHREQLLGTPLVVRSAVLAASPKGLRLHHELAAADSGVLAATFVHGLRPVDGPVPAAAVAAATAIAEEQPAHAAPRSVSLDADLLATAPSLDELRDRGLAFRHDRPVTADECDADGAYRLENIPLLVWGGRPLEGSPPDTLLETAGGQLMGWASMETRIQIGTVLPRVGTRVQAFGALVAQHDKVTHHVHWSYDVDAGRLVAALETVNLAFDTRARRPMPIPPHIRERGEARLHADLLPRVPA